MEELGPKLHIVDHVQFQMPKDRELQFPAVAAMQHFVNTYMDRSKQTDVAGAKCKNCGKKRTTPEKCLHCDATDALPIADYELEYANDLDEEHWQYFLDMELVLNTAPVPELTSPSTMLVSLTDDKLLSFMHSGKHACQLCGMMCGIQCPSLVNVRNRQIKVTDFKWAWLGDACPAADLKMALITAEDLLKIGDGEYTGFVGKASWETYAALSLGFGVLEIIPEGRPRNWLSKWANNCYRMIDSPDPKQWPTQIAAAMQSVEDEITQRINAQREKELFRRV